MIVCKEPAAIITAEPEKVTDNGASGLCDSDDIMPIAKAKGKSGKLASVPGFSTPATVAADNEDSDGRMRPERMIVQNKPMNMGHQPKRAMRSKQATSQIDVGSLDTFVYTTVKAGETFATVARKHSVPPYIIQGSMNSKVRHVDLRVFKIRDFIENKEVVLEYCKSHRMIADIGTKALPGPQFHVLRRRLTGYAAHGDEE